MTRYFIEADGHIIEIDYESYLKMLPRPRSFIHSIEHFIKKNKNKNMPIGFDWYDSSQEFGAHRPTWEQVTFYWEEELD